MAAAARRSGREPGAVTLLAVTKGFGVEVAREAFALHLMDLGENRVQEAAPLQAAAEARTLRCYVEVRTTDEATKSGVAREETHALLERMRLLESLRVLGLMTIGPLHGGPEGARSSFRELRLLKDEAVRRGGLGPDAGLSMGMSDDFEIAIEEGATVVRIGSALFGLRS